MNVHGLGPIGKGVGELIVAVLAQVANMERDRIVERCESGRALAKESLRLTGKTHRGKLKFGRAFAADASVVRDWRSANNATIAQTATQFGISKSTVKRYCVDQLALTAEELAEARSQLS